MSAWLLNGLVAVPFAFAVLTRLLGRREGPPRSAVAVLGGVAHASAGRSGPASTLGGARREPTSTSPGSPSSACAGTSGSTGSADRWC